MKKIIFSLMSACLSVLLMSGCIEDTHPSEFAEGSQTGTKEALEALANGTSALMSAYNYFGTFAQQEFGYPAMMLMRDALTDCAYTATSYNHFSAPWATLSDFSSTRAKQPWRYYYLMNLNANLILRAIPNPDEASEKFQVYYGNALVFRAMSYLDLMRMYEYKKTGVAALDAEAENNKIWGLTCVIVDENFDDKNATNNPRAPFYTMYRFILTDLNKAAKYLEGFTRDTKTKANSTVVDAYKARLWLEIATRFQKYPADLAAQLEHEDDEELAAYDKLGITSAADCYRNAALYARKVIGQHTPLTENEWHSKTNGFNNASVNSWVFAICISSIDAVHSRVDSFHSNCATEFSRGYSRSQYHCYRMIDKNLYDKIDDADWRKVTWIDPADAGKTTTPAQYHTLLSAPEWALRDAYVGFKFRPNDGDTSDDYITALQVDFPVIRVEEMYFIEAEAKAYAEGMASGIEALKTFLNTYRYKDGTYDISPTNVDDFVDNFLIVQKRIELWGEGLSYFDIKRREIRLTRGYTGSNWQAAIRYNSLPDNTPSWLNFYIPREGEASLNKAVLLNPNPSVVDSYGLWTGN